VARDILAVINRSIPNTPDGACGFERNYKGWCFDFEFSSKLFGYFRARDRTQTIPSLLGRPAQHGQR
jgi:hypothetical protein